MKKLLEKDGFYLALFVCVCLVAVGGVWFTKSNVEELASNNGVVTESNNNSRSNDDELHLIQDNSNEALPTSTDSNQNLEQAKEKQKVESKLNFLGTEVIREYSEEPSYSETLDVWEMQRGLYVSANEGQEIRSLLDGKATDVFEDDRYGVSIKVESEDGIVVIYSNLDSNVQVEKDQEINEGQSLGIVGNTAIVAEENGYYVRVQACQNDEFIDPMTLID